MQAHSTIDYLTICWLLTIRWSFVWRFKRTWLWQCDSHRLTVTVWQSHCDSDCDISRVTLWQCDCDSMIVRVGDWQCESKSYSDSHRVTVASLLGYLHLTTSFVSIVETNLYYRTRRSFRYILSMVNIHTHIWTACASLVRTSSYRSVYKHRSLFTTLNTIIPTSNY